MKYSKLLISLLSVGLLISTFFILSSAPPGKAVINQEKNKKITVFSEKQVGKDGASTKLSYFNTTPESPGGKRN